MYARMRPGFCPHSRTRSHTRTHTRAGVPPSRQRWLALQQRHAGCQLYMPAGYDNTMVALMLDDCRTLASYGGLRPDLEIHAAAAASPATAFGYAPPEMTAAHLSTIKEGGVNGGGCSFGSGGSGLSSEASVAAAVFEDEFASAPLPPPAAPSTTAAAAVTSVTSAGLSSGASDSCVLSGPGGGGYGYSCRQSTATAEATTTQFANLMFGRASAPAAPLTTAAALFSLQHCQQQQQQQCPPALLSAFASECAAASGGAGAGGSSSAQQHWLHSSGAAHSGMMNSSGSQMVSGRAGLVGRVGGARHSRRSGDRFDWGGRVWVAPLRRHPGRAPAAAAPPAASAAASGTQDFVRRRVCCMLYLAPPLPPHTPQLPAATYDNPARSPPPYLGLPHLLPPLLLQVLQPSGSLASVQRLVGDMYESYEDPSGRSLFLM